MPRQGTGGQKKHRGQGSCEKRGQLERRKVLHTIGERRPSKSDLKKSGEGMRGGTDPSQNVKMDRKKNVVKPRIPHRLWGKASCNTTGRKSQGGRGGRFRRKKRPRTHGWPSTWKKDSKNRVRQEEVRTSGGGTEGKSVARFEGKKNNLETAESPRVKGLDKVSNDAKRAKNRERKGRTHANIARP